MIKTLLTAALCAMTLNMSAQIADVSAPKALLRGIETDMYYPSLSADGHTLTFSDLNQNNIRVYDFDDNVTTRVKAAPATKTSHGVSASVEGSKLIIDINGHRHTCSPVECYAGYCWPSVSPDGKKIMFVAAGKGVFITDLNGNIIANPGRYEAPAWFGNDHIVVMNATDDGHQLRSSQIILLTADGSQKQELTKPESMSMNPTAAISAGRVVYNTIDGRMYEMKVTLR